MAIAFFEEKLQLLRNRATSKSTNGAQKQNARESTVEEVAATLNSLGMLSCRAGMFVEAIDYYDEALNIQKQLGCDKAHLATARVLAATVQFHLGYFRKALRLLEDALAVLRIELGIEHETVAATWFQIGVVKISLCEYDDAMDALDEALRIQSKLLGKHHPATLRTRREIGNMFAIYEEEVDAAFQQFFDIIDCQKRIHGNEHPNVAETLHSLGCAHIRNGDSRSALKILEQCYYMRVEFMGTDHPLQATTLHEIASILLQRGNIKKAIHVCNTVLEIRKEYLSERHIDVARTLALKGSCLLAQAQQGGGIGNTGGSGSQIMNEAFQCIKTALQLAEQAVGNAHPYVADIHVRMASIYLGKCEFDECKKIISKAFQMYTNSHFDEDHPSIKNAISLLQKAERDEMLFV